MNLSRRLCIKLTANKESNKHSTCRCPRFHTISNPWQIAKSSICNTVPWTPWPRKLSIQAPLEWQRQSPNLERSGTPRELPSQLTAIAGATGAIQDSNRGGETRWDGGHMRSNRCRLSSGILFLSYGCLISGCPSAPNCGETRRFCSYRDSLEPLPRITRTKGGMARAEPHLIPHTTREPAVAKAVEGGLQKKVTTRTQRWSCHILVETKLVHRQGITTA